MPTPLRADALTRLEAASRAILTPVDGSDPVAWAGAIGDALRALVGAEYSAVWLPTPGPLASHGLERETLAGYRHYLDTSRLLDGEPPPDPLIAEFMEHARTAGIEVYDYPTIDRVLDGRLRHSAFHNEVERAAGFRRMVAAQTVIGASGDASVVGFALASGRPGTAATDDEARALLRLLIPAFRTAMAGLVRHRTRRRVLEGLAVPLVLYDDAGIERFRNPALVRLASAEPEADRLMAAAGRLARDMATLSAHSLAGGFPLLDRSVRTGRGVYDVHAVPVEGDAPDAPPSWVVEIHDRTTPVLPSHDEMRDRYDLTRREAEVARLLAEGLSNDAVAGRLVISPSTARSHTERVLSKLGLHSRKALALKLLREFGMGATEGR